MRKAAALALGKLGNPIALEALVKALEDNEQIDKENWERTPLQIRGGKNLVSDGVIEALGLLGDPRAIRPLVEKFNNSGKGNYTRLGHRVCEALWQLGPDGITEAMKLRGHVASTVLAGIVLRGLRRHAGDMHVADLVSLSKLDLWHVHMSVDMSEVHQILLDELRRRNVST
jgi:hypothetical protein